VEVNISAVQVPDWFQGWTELSPQWNVVSLFRAACWEAPVRLAGRISVESEGAVAVKRPAVPGSVSVQLAQGKALALQLCGARTVGKGPASTRCTALGWLLSSRIRLMVFGWGSPKKSLGVGPQDHHFACSKKTNAPKPCCCPCRVGEQLLPQCLGPAAAGLSISTKRCHLFCKFSLLHRGWPGWQRVFRLES